MPIPPDAFFLDRSAGLPLQVQLRRQIIAAVTAGRFRAGEKLPSTRARAIWSRRCWTARRPLPSRP